MISTTIRACFPIAAQVVADKADEINKLNVFPVPDGDTGTNMSLTLQTVVREVEALPSDATMKDIAHAITHGSLMGARGNSGVITSQILRGISEGLVPAKGEHATTADIAAALRNGVKVAFKAVRKPVEGTILTVLRDVSKRCDLSERKKLSFEEALDALERVGLRERAKHLPSQLSGGEQQRVCVARALINHPELILADEPTGNLDEANENIVLDLFRQLHREGTTLIVVTHDPEVAEAAQRTIVLEHGKVAREIVNENFVE